MNDIVHFSATRTVAILTGCYDNPLFSEEDDRDHKVSGTRSRGSAGSGQQDGHTGISNDYINSFSSPGSQTLSEIRIAQKTRRRHLLKFAILCIIVIAIIAVAIGLIVRFMHKPKDTSYSPVIGLSRQLQGSLTIVDGPFSLYKKEYEDNTSSAFSLLLQSFRFKMDSIFTHSSFKDVYSRTDILRVSSGSVVLHFIVVLREARLLTKSDIQDMTSVIQNGLQDSIFALKEQSLSLKAQILDRGTTVSPPPRCQSIRIAQCANLTSYQNTAFPNPLGHANQEDAGSALSQVLQTMSQVCRVQPTVFLCSLFAPRCGPDSRPVPPCRSFCEEVYSQCNVSTTSGVSFPVDCNTLPDSADPNVCMPSPYTPGKCVPIRNELCRQEGFNSTAFPNLMGNEEEAEVSPLLDLIMAMQMATGCYKYSMLFGCSSFLSPCSGNGTVGHHIIPPCKSLCNAYKTRCEIFLNIFYVLWPKGLECDNLVDSSDPTVCVGYKEANEPPVYGECKHDAISCDDHRCVSTSWRCDGFQDCQDNLDESHCASCMPHETLCSTRSALCINSTDVCDGDDHCYRATDERECVRVGEFNDSRVLEVHNAVTAMWEEVCSSGWNQPYALLTCQQLGYSTVLTNSLETATPGRSKAILGTLRPGSRPDRLQSFLTKGNAECPAGDNNVVKLTCWEPVCGMRPARYKSLLRVVGGDEVKPGTWPWLVSLHGGSDQKFFCGGSIINSEWILTAGHCVGGASQRTNYWTVVAGHTRRMAYSVHRQIRKPKKLFLYPKYNHSTVDNDIALVQLDSPLVLGDYLWPICLPRSGQDVDVATRCYVAGWGKNDTAALSYQPAVREVNLDVVTWESCLEAIKPSEKQVPYRLTRNMFCAGGAAGHDACQGDSGGPFMCLKPNTTDQWYQAGIVSWGISCAVPNSPGIYTRVPLYIDWIEETIRNNTST